MRGMRQDLPNGSDSPRSLERWVQGDRYSEDRRTEGTVREDPGPLRAGCSVPAGLSDWSNPEGGEGEYQDRFGIDQQGQVHCLAGRRMLSLLRGLPSYWSDFTGT